MRERFYLNPRRGPIESLLVRAQKILAFEVPAEIGIMGAEG